MVKDGASRSGSIRWRFKAVAMVSSGVSLLVACGCFAFWVQWSERQSVRRRLESLAEIIAFQSSVAASVGDARNAREILQGLSAEPEVLEATIEGTSNLLARYERSGTSEEARLDVRRPILQENVRVGEVVLRSCLSGLERQAWLNAAALGVFLLISLAAAFALSNRLEPLIINPVLRLAGLVRDVGARPDYSVRSPEGGDDELGELQRGFNHMLSQIERRDAELEATRRDLEKRVEERTRELREKEAQLTQAQKMEAIGRLAGGVAHDFNNLLAVIMGYSDLLLGRPGLEREAREQLREIGEASRKAAGLTKQLLAFSRRQIMKPTLLDLNAAVGEAQRLLRRLIGEHVEIRAALEDDLGRVRADPIQVQQVVLNLAINARDAMPRGGVLTISTKNERVERPLIWRSERIEPGDYVTMAVADTGEGMSEAVLSHLFEPFFTTKEAGKGTGLGLSTVYGIIKQSGGALLVRSAPGEGSVFTCYFPRAVGEASRSALPVPALAESAARGRVLVTEDDPVVRRLVTYSLRQAGYDVHEAVDGPDALRVAEALSGELDLLLTDVLMPRMEGRELAERLGARRPGLRVLFMSGYTDDEAFRKGLESATIHFIQKPFTPMELREAVRGALAAQPVRPA